MKQLLLLLFLFSPITVVGANEPIKSNKIHLGFVSYYGLPGTLAHSVRSWVDAISHITCRPCMREVKILLNFDTIKAVRVEDLNVRSGACKFGDQSWKNPILFMALFDNIKLPELTSRIYIPCVSSKGEYKKYIKLKVNVWTKDGAYYKVFTLYDMTGEQKSGQFTVDKHDITKLVPVGSRAGL